MKLSAHHRLTRRSLVRALGTAAFALPALELFERSARAQTAPNQSKYIVFCYTPDGVNQSAFWPTGTPTSDQLSEILAPFEKYKDKLLILGPQMNGNALVGDTGLTYFAPVAQPDKRRQQVGRRSLDRPAHRQGRWDRHHLLFVELRDAPKGRRHAIGHQLSRRRHAAQAAGDR
jgi:hypothetical protein